MASRGTKIGLVLTWLLILVWVWVKYSGSFQISDLGSSAIPTGNFICSVEWQKAGLTNYNQLKSAVTGYTAQVNALKTSIQKSQESSKKISITIKKEQAVIASTRQQITPLKSSLKKCTAIRLKVCTNETKLLADAERRLKTAENSLAASRRQRDQLVKNMKPMREKIEKLNKTYRENVAKLQNYELCEKSLAGKVTLSSPNITSEVTIVAELDDNIEFYNFEVRHNTSGGWRETLTADEIIFDIEMSKDTDFVTWYISQDNNENSPSVLWDCTLSDTKKILKCLPIDPAAKFVLSKPSSYEHTTRYRLGAIARDIESSGQILIKNPQLKLSDAQTTIESEATQKITKYEKWVPPSLVSNMKQDTYWSPENENQKSLASHSIAASNLDITLNSIYYPIHRNFDGGQILTENIIKEAYLMQWSERLAMTCNPDTSLNQSAVPIIYGVYCISNGNIVIPKWTTTDIKLVIVFDTSSVTYTNYSIHIPRINYTMKNRQYSFSYYEEPFTLFIANKNKAYWHVGYWNSNNNSLKRLVECRKTGAKVADTLCTQKKPVIEQVILQSFVIVSPSLQTVKTQESAKYTVRITNTSWRPLKDVTINPSWGQGCTLAPEQMRELFISGELRVKPLHTGGATASFDPNESIEFTCNQTYPNTGYFWEFHSFHGYSLTWDTLVSGSFNFMTIVEDTPLCNPSTPDSSDGETVWEIGICMEYTPL